jgi:DNA-binding transcriptional LysR family regulator
LVNLELETRRLQILDIQDFPIQRHGYVMQRKGKRLSPAAQAFKTFVLEHAKDFIRLP